jgi:hypothetical protein
MPESSDPFQRLVGRHHCRCFPVSLAQLLVAVTRLPKSHSTKFMVSNRYFTTMVKV